MVPLYIASTLIGGTLVAFTILSHVYLWQRKEYRWDRMRAYLTSEESNYSRDALLWMFVAFTVAAWLSYYVVSALSAEILSWFAMTTLAIKAGRAIAAKGIFRPTPTKKSIFAGVVSVVLVITALGLILPLSNSVALTYVVVLLLTPVLVAAAVWITNGITNIRKGAIISQAKALRAAKKNLQVVAITGSVGKTTTKEYLVHILRHAGRNVVATKEHRNSEFTVAQDVLENLQQEPGFYVVEAAAYRAGEITAIMDIVQPTVGVLTEITNQHQGLFGSLEALANAKWEVVEGLPDTGTAILHKDNAVIATRAATTKKKVVFFSTQDTADVYVSNVVHKERAIECELHIKDEVERVTVPIVGRGSLVALLAAVSTARTLGISFADITGAISSLPHIPRTMEVVPGIHGSTVIDDSYSGSEASYANGLEHLSIFPHTNKRVVLVPIIELGTSASAVHERVGSLLRDSNATVYIFGEAHRADITKGLGADNKRVMWFTDATSLKEAVSKDISENTVLLLEGRLPGIVRTSLIVS